MSSASRLPGGPISKRPLHLIFLLDVSGSMRVDGKIQALNNAIRQALPAISSESDHDVRANLLVRAVTFSNGARWYVEHPTPVRDFVWTDVTADGDTDMGAALRLVAEALRMPPMDIRSLPPVLVLMTDGQPTDDFAGGLKALKDEFWGQRAVRVGIAIGRAADRRCLAEFIDDPRRQVLDAYNAVSLAKQIEFASTLAIGYASGDRPEPIAPLPPDPTDDPYVWK
jgi:uncharacterized protein YegL